MSNPVIEIKINHNIATGSKTNLFPAAIDTRGVPIFCFQFIVTGVVGAPLDGLIKMKVSNDNINFKNVPITVLSPAGYSVTIDTAGNSSYFVFVGMAEGIGTARYINFSFTVNGLTAGIITKAIYVGDLGTA